MAARFSFEHHVDTQKLCYNGCVKQSSFWNQQGSITALKAFRDKPGRLKFYIFKIYYFNCYFILKIQNKQYKHVNILIILKNLFVNDMFNLSLIK